MAEEEFEIDIYGDANNEQAETEGDGSGLNGDENHDQGGNNGDGYDGYDGANDQYDETHNEDQSATATPQAAPQQGVKRKEGSDERPVDPGATTALMISELNWWNTDDDIRGWVTKANCEDELKDITFSEHKINGKSKGQAYLEFTSQQAASATKHTIDALVNESGHPGQKKQTVIYSSPSSNPFRTLPKDAPARGVKDGQTRAPSGPGYSDRGSNNMSGGTGNYNGGFRGGRGGYNNGPRGGGMNQGGGFNRNFSNNNGGFNNNNNMGGFNPMGGGNFGGFNRGGGMMGGGMGGGMRGGPGGMRGGRGGGVMNGMGGMMGGMPMGGMPMGGMPGAMGGMGMMGAGMPGFQGMPHFNPAFFGGGNQSGGNNEWQNPHGAKRARGE